MLKVDLRSNNWILISTSCIKTILVVYFDPTRTLIIEKISIYKRVWVRKSNKNIVFLVL